MYFRRPALDTRETHLLLQQRKKPVGSSSSEIQEQPGITHEIWLGEDTTDKETTPCVECKLEGQDDLADYVTGDGRALN